MEQPTKKQKTSNGAAPGIGNAPSPAPQPQHNKKSNPDFELPVASIVRLVKRVRLLFGNHLKKRYTLVLVGPQQRIQPFRLLLVHGPRFVVDLSCPPLPTSVAESLTTVSFLFFAVLCVVCVSASKKGKTSVWAATPN